MEVAQFLSSVSLLEVKPGISNNTEVNTGDIQRYQDTQRLTMTGYLFIKFNRPSGNGNIETHQVTAIIEEAKPNCCQYYRTRGLHKNYHGWINGRDLKAFTGWHDSNGFERVTGRLIERGYLPRKY